MANDIDFVVTWVDGNDPEWQNTRAKFLGNITSGDNSGENRYRDWDLMRYWFRGVEKYAPWVNRIHFVQDTIYGKEMQLANLDKVQGVIIRLRKNNNLLRLPSLPSDGWEEAMKKVIRRYSGQTC